MGRQTAVAAPPKAVPPARRTVTKFVAPDSVPEEFGAYTVSDEMLDGFIKPQEVRSLLDTFGLQKRTSVVFPFQHIERRDGDMYTLRVDPFTSHDVDGKTVFAQHWVYKRQPKDQY